MYLKILFLAIRILLPPFFFTKLPVVYIVIATIQRDVSSTYFDGAIFLGRAPFLGDKGTPGASTMLETFPDLDA